jgi:endogenous inhibitor of DNA gyrase (YacG/DUF329 family)
MSAKPFPCPICAKSFASINDRRQHVTDVHAHRQRVPCDVCGKQVQGRRVYWRHLRSHEEREPSLADLMVEAEQARAAGEPVPEWIREMMP